jgi:tricorn protease
MPDENARNQGYIRFPTIHGDHIVFTAEDDLWSVSASGGRAERLTAGVAEATHARFSSDGQLLAFAGREEGPAEVYVMPAAGGEARRLTFQGGNAAILGWRAAADAAPAGWRADGSAILYVSPAGQPSPRMRVLQQISPSGGEPSTLPYGPAHSIAFGPRGALVLGRNTADPARWKRYRGGTAGYFWIDPTGDGEFRRLIDLRGNLASPCWVGDRIYFISDHEGTGSVYSCLPSGEDLRRHTAPGEYYARWLSTDGRRLVYHAGGDLYLLEPDAQDGVRLEVTLPANRPQRARKFVPAGKYMDAWAPHPQGHSVALSTRGKVFGMGNWEGAVLQHGEADGPRYRLVRWLADGKRLVALHDGREARLVVLSADGSAPDRLLDRLDIGHVTQMRASPVGEQVLLRNHRLEIVLVDLAAETARVLDRSPYDRESDLRRTHGLAWAPDGQWVAYSSRINGQQTVIKLCHIPTGDVHVVTEPVLYDVEPAFDPQGRYLYFIGARDFDPVTDYAQFEWSFPRIQRPYLIALRRDLRSPFTPEPEAPRAELEEKLEVVRQEDEQAEARRRQPAPVRVDLEGITERIVAFPVPAGRYGRVQGTAEGVVFTSFPLEGTLEEHQHPFVPEAKGTLEGYSFETHKQERLAEGISDFEVSLDGKTLLYRAGERLRSIKAGEKAPEGQSPEAGKPGRESGWIDLGRVKVSVRPESEWRQMFGEAWRLQREQFWTADMGGVDWRRVYERYVPLLERVGSRAELSDLMWEMQGELGSSHAYEAGGEYRERPQYRQGFLGVDWRFEPSSGRYQIARIVRGDPWDAEARSPLLAPGTNVAGGDAVLAIDGQRVTPERGPQQLLVNQAGQEVQLLIAPADGSAQRTVTVRAIADEFPARYRDWVEAKRRAVREATGGRVGYLHVPDMMYRGFAEFHRSFLAEYDRDGLIVDVRWNSGGMVSGLLLEKLARRRIGYDFQRWGSPTPYFAESPRGPLVAVTDENAGSDGDIFSHVFKLLGLGPLIGKRTWGGVVGIDPYIPLADGTETTQPEFAFWFQDVGWGVENYGTDPTIEVDYPPQDYARGVDPQLDRAIAEALRLLAERDVATPTPGPRPDRG